MSDNMNEKYQQHYNQILTGTLTDSIMKSVSYQANIKLANDIIAEQEKTIQELKESGDVAKKEAQMNIETLKKELEDLKFNKTNSENVKISSLEASNKNYLASISKLNTDIAELNRQNQSLKVQVANFESVKNELIKTKDDVMKLRQIHQQELDGLSKNFELEIAELTKTIETLKQTPEKTNGKSTVRNLEAVTSKKKDVLVKDGGNF